MEVRTKSNNFFGEPEETVKSKKKRKIIQGASMYINFKKYKGESRLDLIAITLNDNHPPKINHYKNI